MSAKRKDGSILSFFSKKVKQLDDVVSVDVSESDVPLPQNSDRRDTRVTKPKFGDDGSTVNPEKYFRVSICLPYIDFFINQLEERFLAHRSIFGGNVDELVNFYLSTNIQIVKAKLSLWKTKLSRIGKSPKSGLDAIRICNPELFPNVRSLSKIFCTLPVSTATPERMFSCLKRLKTYLRNTMVENRLNGLATIAVHRGVVNITADEVLDELAKKKRKIDLII